MRKSAVAHAALRVSQNNMEVGFMGKAPADSSRQNAPGVGKIPKCLLSLVLADGFTAAIAIVKSKFADKVVSKNQLRHCEHIG